MKLRCIEKIKFDIFKCKNNLLTIDELLKYYHSRDVVHLNTEKNILNKKLQEAEEILEVFKWLDKQSKKNTLRYIYSIKQELNDFIIILRWCNFGILETILKSLIGLQETILSSGKEENYQNLLKLMKKAC